MERSATDKQMDHGVSESDALIHQLFEQQARRTPHHLAFACEVHSLTYQQLNRKANQLAHALRLRGAGPDRLIGLHVERSLEMVISILAILKSGAAYVPLDPAYPPERIAYMLCDAAPSIVLTQTHLRDLLPLTSDQVLVMDAADAAIGAQPDTDIDPSRIGLCARNLAFVIYTSGSTGQPKGAMNEHRGMVNRIRAQRDIERFCAGDVCCQKTSISFVDAVLETLGPVCAGYPVVIIPPKSSRNPRELAAVIARAGVTRLVTVPSLARAMLESDSIVENLSSLRSWTLSGEPVPADLARRLQQRLPGCVLINQYGASEVSSDAAVYREANDIGDRVPAGRPLPHTRIFLLDSQGEPVPMGAIGEIHVAGINVGRGYLGRPALTAERFVSDPFSTRIGERMYRTGDRGRWRPDGLLECLGRTDQQVKIRGVRIELAEIEAKLRDHAHIRDAVVVAREDSGGELSLVSYVVPRTAECGLTTPAELRAHLRSHLPELMVPAAFVALEQLPLTPNGKVDRRALPAPRRDDYARVEYEPPRDEREELLAGIWQRVLNLPRVSRRDNFFELGGHSLRIVAVLDDLARHGWFIEAHTLYTSRTLADLACALSRAPAAEASGEALQITPSLPPLIALSSTHHEQIARVTPGGAANIYDIYPLAPLQEGLLFHHLLSAHGADAYVSSTLLQVSSEAELEKLMQALQAVIDRNDILRTAFLWEDLPQPLQVVLRQVHLPIERVRVAPGCGARKTLMQRMQAGRDRMDLRSAPLLRLLTASDGEGAGHYALLKLHHIVDDDVSLKILIAEIVAHLSGRAHELSVAVPYRHYVARALAYARTQAGEAFFRSKLADIDEPTAPFELSDVHGDGAALQEARELIDSELAERIRRQAKACAVSPAILFHAAWALVVAHTSAREDVVLGSVLLGRLQGGVEASRSMGMLINTLPLRIRFGTCNARGLLAQIQQALADLLEHEQASLAMAQRCSSVAPSTPLFSTVLNYRHDVAQTLRGWDSVPGVRVVAEQDRTSYPITVSIDERPCEFALLVQTDLRIDPHRIAGYVRTALHCLCEALDTGSARAVLELPILPEAERHELLEDFNATSAPYPAEKLIYELFEAHVDRTPQAPAVIYEGQTLSYAALNIRANQLAHHLRQHGTQPGEYVPVMLARSLELLIAQLAVLKAGGAYLPVDPSLPPERRAFLIEDSQARRVIADHARPVGEVSEAVQWIDLSACAQQIASQPRENLGSPRRARAPAYVMYTSGSTGMPKGVVVPHSAVNRLAINNGYAQIEPTDRLSFCSNPAFDASTFEVWGALLNGAAVIIVPQSIVLDASRLARTLVEQRVTILWITVGLFTQYLEELMPVFGGLRYLLTGGDVVDPQAAGEVLRRNPPQHFLNAYGPTECTTFSTTYPITLGEANRPLPIGRPIANARVYILNRQLQPVPLGVAGEIYIGGAGVALGYLNRPELTASRFMADPFSRGPDAYMYRTGDLGRWRPDGMVEFLGRNDHQVKIRGFRIELGEIETYLAAHASIKEAVVLVREDVPGEKRLVAYLRAGPAGVPLIDVLRAHLRSVLPDYMVPSAFVALEQFPLSSSGKVDRRAFPAPERESFASRAYESPQGEIEEVVTEIWKELLRVERVGRQDNFFELGGHSLLATRVITHIGHRLEVDLPLRIVFEKPTVRDLSDRIAQEIAAELAMEMP